MKWLISLSLALLIGSAAAPVMAQQVKPLCRTNSRACLLKTTRAYLDGLSRHDSAAIPFTPDVRATEQAGVVVTNEAKFRSEIDSSGVIKGARNVRFMVDPKAEAVAAFYVLDIAGEGGKPDYSVWRGERFKIVKGYITEVEVYNYIEPQPKGLGAALWLGGVTFPAKP
jgi:hypothetical protein